MEEQLKKVMDLFGADFTPEVQEDVESIDFDKPLRGKYVVAIKGLNRYKGESDKCEGGVYDFWSLKMQVQETIEGDKGLNRYLTKIYSNTASQYQEDPMEGMKKLMNDLFTAGVEYDVVREADTDAFDIIEQIAPQIVDQTMNISAYPSKSKKQVIRVVKEFKIKNNDNNLYNTDNSLM